MDISNLLNPTNLLIAGSALLILIVVVIFIQKSKKNKEPQEALYDYRDIEVIPDIYEEDEKEKSTQEAVAEAKEEEQTSQDSSQTTSQTEENENIQENHNNQAILSSYNPKTKANPIEVPPHPKVTKESFKEFVNLKILVAEDNLINQKVIDGLLKESGIEVVFANDGMEAISLLNNQKDFDIILMDAHMPNLDGFEATKKIREHQEFVSLPIIALSGDVASDDIRKMYESGMDAHLEKPLNIEALYDILYAFTKKHKDVAKEESCELDIAKGVELAGGDKDFYKEIVAEFIHNYENAHNELKSLIEANKFEEVDKLILDIMGISANIGAQNVHDNSYHLKEALREKNIEAIKSYFKKFYSSFEKLLKEAKEYLK